MRSVSGHPARTQRQWLNELAGHAADLPLDVYGQGTDVQDFEAEVARLLGKPAAIFVPKGVIAQQAALRVWCDRSGTAAVAVHPRCHLVEDEDYALTQLHRIRLVLVGDRGRPFGAAELDACTDPVGAVTVELPLRRAGFQLPQWDELRAISHWARARGLPLHLDGARLWESQPFYDRRLAEITAVADSVYVSFYKGLGGLGGCVLAGPVDFIDAAKPWLARHGAYPFSIAAYVIAARTGLARHLPKMPGYVARCRQLASMLRDLPGVRLIPDPPHTNGVQVVLPAPKAALEARLSEVQAQIGLRLFRSLQEAEDPGRCFGEIQIGEAAEKISDGEIVDGLRRLLSQFRT